MRMPEIDPEIIKLSKEMSAAKAEREKKAARREWWRNNIVGIVGIAAGIAVGIITIVVSILLDLN